MRIVHVIPQLASGGGERFTIDLCNTLAAQGYEVALVVLLPLGEYGFYRSEVSDKVKLVCLDKKPGLDISLGSRLKKTISDFAPDVVHSHLRAMLYMPLSVFSIKTKFFHTVHNKAEVEAGGFIGGLIRKFMFKTGKVTPVTISLESLDSFEKYYGHSAPMIFNGRDIPESLEVSDAVKQEIDGFKKSADTKVLVHLARYTDVKRQDLMARVSRRLHNEGFDFTVLLIGRTAEDILNGVKAANCPVCHVLGEKKNPLEYLKAADAFCLCSTFEGMPISLIEAMGVGAIPVCTPVGGIVNVVKDGETGFLSTDIAEDSYYEALKRFLMQGEDDKAVMKTKVLKAYEPYTMRECANKYLNLYNNK